MAPTTENMPVFQLGSTEGPYKGSLAWAAALQTPSYVISYEPSPLLIVPFLPSVR